MAPNFLFDSPFADVVLVSNDIDSPVEFHVHRSVLSIASPFFRDMFSLPQALSPEDKIPTIPMSETGQVLEALLRFIYPVPNPTITSLEQLEILLRVSMKYEMETATASLRSLLVSSEFLHSSPLKIYAIACRHDFDDEARIASKYTLSTNLLDAPLSNDLKYITAYRYHQLLTLHKKRSAAAVTLLDRIEDQVKCMQCNGSLFTLHLPPKWWTIFKTRSTEELNVRPTTDVVFSYEFLYSCAAKTGCVRCPGSALESWKCLVDLKAAIDALPATI